MTANKVVEVKTKYAKNLKCFLVSPELATGCSGQVHRRRACSSLLCCKSQLLLSPFPKLSSLAENNHPASVNRPQSPLSSNPCVGSFHSVPPDPLFSLLHPASRPGRLTSWESNTGPPCPPLLIGCGRRRISLLQCGIHSLPRPGMIQALVQSGSLLEGHPISLWQFYL